MTESTATARAPKAAPVVEQHNLESATDQAGSIATDLRDELQEWYDNLPENFQNGDKGSQLQEAIDLLEEVVDQVPSVPDCLQSSDGTTGADEPLITFRPSTKKRMSRADRCSEASELLSLAADEARSWATQRREAFDQRVLDKAYESAEDEEAAEASMESDVGEAEAWADEVEGMADTLGGVEFPRAFG